MSGSLRWIFHSIDVWSVWAPVCVYYVSVYVSLCIVIGSAVYVYWADQVLSISTHTIFGIFFCVARHSDRLFALNSSVNRKNGFALNDFDLCPFCWRRLSECGCLFEWFCSALSDRCISRSYVAPAHFYVFRNMRPCLRLSTTIQLLLCAPTTVHIHQHRSHPA